jgi:hypothetical protein
MYINLPSITFLLGVMQVEEGWYASEVAERLARRTSRTFEELKAKWRWSAGKRRDPKRYEGDLYYLEIYPPLERRVRDLSCDFVDPKSFRLSASHRPI